MCGISGIYNFSNKPVNLGPAIEKIVKLQHHRGPDDQGIWQSKCKKVFFGHNRLTIIDLSKNGSQPFVSKDENYIITFNGEIYNFKEIKMELVEKNISFKSNSDTEVIIESYKYWGLDFVKKLRGMFAFVIWDSIKKKLILARDPFGIKPLYYSKKNGIYYFASQVKSLLTIEDINFDKSKAGIVSYFLWGHIQEPLTIYKDIESIESGTCTIIEKNGNVKNFRYADIKDTILNSPSLNLKDERDAINYLKNIVQETVKYHQVSDIPVTFLLSSGIDSNVIVSLINDNEKENCSALTLDFDYKEVTNESALAKKATKNNNISHHIGKIEQNEIGELINIFYNKMDLPTNDGLNNFLVSYIAKKNGSKVIISGVGGDELFFGYPSFNRIPKLNKVLKFFPNSKLINNIFKLGVYPFLKSFTLNTKYSGIYEYGKNLGSAFFLQKSLFLPHEVKEILTPGIFKEGFEELNTLENIKKDIKNIEETKLSIMYLELKYYLSSKLLRDADWTSMSHSVEMRTPFVDWFFFKKLVPLLKSKININKKTLLRCADNKVPNELYSRRKTGFAIPYKSYLQKLTNDKIKYSHPIKDWSTFTYKKYLDQNIK